MDYLEKVWSFSAEFINWRKIVYMKHTFRKILGLVFLACAFISFGMNFYFVQKRASAASAPPPTVVQPPKASTKISASEQFRKGVLKEAMLQKSSEIESCYNSYLNAEPKTREGSVVISWTMTTKGEVIEPQVVQTELDDSKLHSCLIDMVAHMEMKAPSQETVVSQRFVFKQRKLSSLDFQ